MFHQHHHGCSTSNRGRNHLRSNSAGEFGQGRLGESSAWGPWGTPIQLMCIVLNHDDNNIMIFRLSRNGIVMDYGFVHGLRYVNGQNDS